MDDRYQNQSVPVQVYRIARYLPATLCRCLWTFLWSVRHGFPSNDIKDDETGEVLWHYTRWQQFKLNMSLSWAMFDMDLKHYYTSEEVFGKIRLKTFDSDS